MKRGLTADEARLVEMKLDQARRILVREERD
jgi:hypothetical protein